MLLHSQYQKRPLPFHISLYRCDSALWAFIEAAEAMLHTIDCGCWLILLHSQDKYALYSDIYQEEQKNYLPIPVFRNHLTILERGSGRNHDRNKRFMGSCVSPRIRVWKMMRKQKRRFCWELFSFSRDLAGVRQRETRLCVCSSDPASPGQEANPQPMEAGRPSVSSPAFIRGNWRWGR